MNVGAVRITHVGLCGEWSDGVKATLMANRCSTLSRANLLRE